MDAKRLWAQWALFERRALELRDEWRRAGKDPDLTERARLERQWEIQSKYEASHEATIKPGRDALPGVEGAYLASLPGAQEAAAAAKAPGEAVAVRDLATGASFENLGRFVEDAAGTQSLAKAHGLRQAISRSPDLSDERRAALLQRLDSVSAGRRHEAMAELVAFRRTLGAFEAAAKSVDGIIPALRDPEGTLTMLRGAGKIRTGDGPDDFREIGENEARQLVEHAGVPLHPPGGGE